MRILYISLFFITINQTFGQINIKGTIRDLPNAQVSAFIYKGFEYNKVSSVNSDSLGVFSLPISKPYKGVIVLSVNNKPLYLLSDNKDIEFEVDAKKQSYKVYKGKSQKVFSYLTTNKDDIANQILSKNPNIYAHYYLDLRRQLAKMYESKDPKILESLQDSLLYRLKYENENLYTSAAIQEVVDTYLFFANKTKIDDIDAVLDDTVHLLNEVGVDSKRGQEFSNYLMNKFAETKYYKIRDTIVSLVECAKCKLNPELERTITGFKIRKVGAKVPNIEFKTYDGKNTSLYESKKKYKLIMFWASWCTHCQKVIPKFEKEYPELIKKGVDVFSVSADNEKDKYEKFTKNHKWPYYIDYKDWESPAIKKYGVSSFPSLILVDKDNKFIGDYSSLKEIYNAIKKN